jgi:hypothetical protein
MKHSKKDKFSKINADGASILERYRKLKGERSASGLSQKIMEITHAGAKTPIVPDVCITCDYPQDICDPCDQEDFLCLFGDDTGWCVFTDACPIYDTVDP